jgi:hypothetical protein
VAVAAEHRIRSPTYLLVEPVGLHFPVGQVAQVATAVILVALDLLVAEEEAVIKAAVLAA